MNNKTIHGTLGMILIILVLITSASGQNILTENSNQTINNITISIDSVSLTLPIDIIYNYTEENATYNISEIINNTINYNCTLENFGQFQGSLVENITYHYLETNLSDGIHLLAVDCEYNITTSHYVANISTNLSDNSSSTTSYNYTEETLQNILTEKELIVDTRPPIIELSLYNHTLNVAVSDMTDTSCLFEDNALNVSFNNSLIYTFNSSSNYSILCADLLENIIYYNNTIILNDTLNDTNSTTNNTINETVEEPFLSITINKQSLNLGELGFITINANNNSNVSVTICPQSQGWVQCYVTPTFVNETYPKTQVMPYSNKTGTYVIEAIMVYQNFTLRNNMTFEVINTLNAKISA